jgi:hypothetical protein
MKKYLDIKNIIIVILVLITLLALLNPGGYLPNRTVNVPVTVIDSIPYAVHDTIPYEVEVEVEVPVEVPVEVRVEVPVYQTVDTLLILKDYYAKNQIKEEFKLPNNQGTITLNQIVSQNKVVSTEFSTNIKPKIKKDTLFLPEPKKSQLYFGVVGGLNQKDIISNVGVGLLFKTKNDKIFKVTGGVANRLETDITGSFYPYIEGGVFWKIRAKKKD